MHSSEAVYDLPNRAQSFRYRKQIWCVCVGEGGAEWVVRHNSERKSLPATSTYYGLHVCLPPKFIYVESLTTSGMIFGGRAFGR